MRQALAVSMRCWHKMQWPRGFCLILGLSELLPGAQQRVSGEETALGSSCLQQQSPLFAI